MVKNIRRTLVETTPVGQEEILERNKNMGYQARTKVPWA